MNNWRNPICAWFGCSASVDVWDRDGGPWCSLCGRYVEYDDLAGDTRHNRLMARLRAFRDWFRPCSQCGHWRRCDESVDHIPF